MPIRIVQSRQNARLKQLRRALAQPGERAAGPAGIEGPNLLGEALRARLRIAAVFVAQGAEQLLDGFKLPGMTEILVVPKLILNAALTTETPQPIAALVEPPDWTWAHVLANAGSAPPLVVVLCGLQDPGNLGTILRSAEAFGATGVVSLPGTVSAWNPKAVRASAGSVFRVPVLAASEEDCFTELRAAGVRIVSTMATSFVSGHDFSRAEKGSESARALAPGRKGTGFSPYKDNAGMKGALAPEAPQPAHLADLSGPVALLIGNEGNGVPPNLAAKADGAITILCPGPVESLNAAVAASVLLYETSRQRSLQPPEARENHRRGAHR
jgi:RNA methyltransferase, TrmH family